ETPHRDPQRGVAGGSGGLVRAVPGNDAAACRAAEALAVFRGNLGSAPACGLDAAAAGRAAAGTGHAARRGLDMADVWTHRLLRLQWLAPAAGPGSRQRRASVAGHPRRLP